MFAEQEFVRYSVIRVWSLAIREEYKPRVF
jgi:hypothetical protein